MASSTDPDIAALLREREGYVMRDLPDRVAAVDADLKRRGYKDDDKPKSRSTRQSKQSTAD